MRLFRVYFKKNGVNLTKLVYAESLLEVYDQFKNLYVIQIKEIDQDLDADIPSIN